MMPLENGAGLYGQNQSKILEILQNLIAKAETEVDQVVVEQLRLSSCMYQIHLEVSIMYPLSECAPCIPSSLNHLVG